MTRIEFLEIRYRTRLIALQPIFYFHFLNHKRIKKLKNTEAHYLEIFNNCWELFKKKNQDYGTSWRILRLSSLTDQIYIKAKRLRSIEEKKTQKVSDNIKDEYIGLVNYCIIALIQLEISGSEDIATAQALEAYQKHMKITHQLMLDKNHDYGEAWRDMRVSSLTDLILMKIHRIKQIEDNQGVTIVSEGLDANYKDIINYSIFALIKIAESEE